MQSEPESRREGRPVALVGGHPLLPHGESALLDGLEALPSPAPHAVPSARVAGPVDVEHAVVMAVAA